VADRDRILVIGGTGFIGRALVAQLIDRGCDVRVMTRRARGTSDGDGDAGVRYVQGDVADRASIARAADGVDVVYDLSLAFGASWDDYARTFVLGAENVAAVVLERGIRRLVYTSTISVLRLGGDGRVDEAAGIDRKPELRCWYARGKILAEQSLERLHRERGLPAVILRPGIVVGAGNKLAHPGIGTWLSPTSCAVVGSGLTPLPLVLVEDVAQALVLAKDAPHVDGRTFNLAGDVRPSAAEYITIVAERSKRNFRLAPQSALALQALRTLVWLGKAALGRKDNVWQTWHELQTIPQSAWIDCAAAKSLLGWRPVDDHGEFVRRAVDCHLTPLLPGDLRV
jgi:nucleoside-diphosphate-sugar epimerase